MSLYPAMVVELLTQLNQVLGALARAPRRRLAGLLAELPDDPPEVALEIAELLERELPAGHPMLATVPRSGYRLVDQARDDWAGVGTRLADAHVIETLVRTRLLAEPVVAGGRQHPDSGLIWLEDGLPRFQFAPDSRVWPVVRTVNGILDADDDPWGVADWWLGRNAWLDAVPADLLGRDRDDDLVAAARAVAEEG